jgi:hypothetical protein
MLSVGFFNVSIFSMNPLTAEKYLFQHFKNDFDLSNIYYCPIDKKYKVSMWLKERTGMLSLLYPLLNIEKKFRYLKITDVQRIKIENTLNLHEYEYMLNRFKNDIELGNVYYCNTDKKYKVSIILTELQHKLSSLDSLIQTRYTAQWAEEINGCLEITNAQRIRLENIVNPLECLFLLEYFKNDVELGNISYCPIDKECKVSMSLTEQPDKLSSLKALINTREDAQWYDVMNFNDVKKKNFCKTRFIIINNEQKSEIENDFMLLIKELKN